ncbi:hypothetical protein [Noviherbaspirillum aerium]|uniref:hypothetical protein n=1 Tax=Noviherbaspirillum aerium TaxID=2588497 RepID=UPI00124F539C|nr:hypothetical protein [Noviherbaspirillum aerium]
MRGQKVSSNLLVALGAVTFSCAIAQNQQLVEVSLTNVKSVIATEIQVEVGRIPLMVKVPAETARKVCNVTAEGLKPEANSGVPSCPAEKTAAELNEAVKQQIAETTRSK